MKLDYFIELLQMVHYATNIKILNDQRNLLIVPQFYVVVTCLAQTKKLLVIEKSAKPSCFKNINIENLPVSYLANKMIGSHRKFLQLG